MSSFISGEDGIAGIVGIVVAVLLSEAIKTPFLYILLILLLLLFLSIFFNT